MNQEKIDSSVYKTELEAAVRQCEAMRRDAKNPTDVTLAEFVKTKWNVSMESFYAELGIDPQYDTIQNIVNLPDKNYRWLLPEIYREAIRLGLRKNPIYPGLIAGEQSVSQTSITWPAINMSDATPRKVGPAETIMVGDLSFDQKTVKISKIGRGIKVPYEVQQYVALNVVGIFLQDFGVKLGMGIDYLALITAINGDQPSGTDSAAVVGITTAAGPLVFRDLLRIWVRMSRLGKRPNIMVAGEDMAMDILDLLTLTRVGYGEARANVNIKTPIPNSSDIFVHGAIPTNQVLIIDPTSALIKLNAQPLLVETEKIISNQTQETYATITTGFATVFQDSRLVLDKSLAFSANGFPATMDPTAQEIVTFD